MAKPAIVDIVIWYKSAEIAPAGSNKFNWEIMWTNVSSTGQREERREIFLNKTRVECWTQMRTSCIAWEASILTPPAAPVKEFPGVYDPSIATLASATMNPADYPPGVTST